MIPWKTRLRESGLTPKTAKALALRPLTAQQTSDAAPHFRRAPSLLIPYHDASGKRLSMYRIRYLDTDQLPDLRRYDQPEGLPPRAYLPRLLPWKKIAEDPRIHLTITEGEFKAACACVRDIPTIGLGGVWSWRATKLGISFLPELADFEWKGRYVELCFDSDLSSNSAVRLALLKLSLELVQRGAECKMVLLPGPDKQGIDDFLIAEGRAAYLCLERHTIHPHEAERAEIFAQWAYVDKEDAVVRITDGTIFRNRQHFTNAASSFFVMDSDGKTKSAVAEWYKDPKRIVVPEFVFRPQTSERLLDEGYNLFEGLGVQPKRGSIAPFLKLVDAVVGPRPDLRRWLLQWMAYPLQNLGTKMNSCVFLCHPRQGTGKTSLGTLLLDIYGTTHHGFHLQDHQFFGPWNHWFERGLFVLADDLSFESSREGRATFVNAITSQTVELSAKWRKSKRVENHVNFLFTANSAGALPLDIGKNRRVCVIEVQKILPTAWFLNVFVPWRRKQQGAARLLDYLLRLDLGGFDPNADACDTTERALAIESSAPTLHQWVLDLVQNDLPESDLWTSRQLQEIYRAKKRKDVSPQALARALRAAGSEPLGQQQVNGRWESLWAVRRTQHWKKTRPTKGSEAWGRAFPG